jgi:hypothetical protein
VTVDHGRSRPRLAPTGTDNGALGGIADAFVRPAGFACFIFAYVLFSLAVQQISPVLGKDEASDALWAQQWALAYTPNDPPLYTWLTMLVTGVLGRTPLAHAILRFTLLAAFYLLLYKLARRLIADAGLAALAAASPMLTYIFGVDALRHYTETLLELLLVTATLLLLHRLAERGRIIHCLLLGLYLGLGILAKYTFVLFAVPCAAASLLHPRIRPNLLGRGGVLIVTVAMALVLPHALALARGPQDAAAYLVGKVGIGAGAAAGLVALGRKVPELLEPWWMVALLCLPRSVLRLPASAREEAHERVWLGRMLLFVLLTALVGIFVLHASRFGHHWVMPLIVLAPLYFFRRSLDMPAAPAGRRRYAGILAMALAASLAAETLEVFFGAYRCRRCYDHLDYGALAHRLEAAGFSGGTIVAGDYIVGANLMRFFPTTRVLTSAYPLPPPPRAAPGGQCLILWDITPENEGSAAPLRSFAARMLAAPSAATAPAGRLGAPLRFRATREWRFGYVLLPPASGRC